MRENQQSFLRRVVRQYHSKQTGAKVLQRAQVARHSVLLKYMQALNVFDSDKQQLKTVATAIASNYATVEVARKTQVGTSKVKMCMLKDDAVIGLITQLCSDEISVTITPKSHAFVDKYFLQREKLLCVDDFIARVDQGYLFLYNHYYVWNSQNTLCNLIAVLEGEMTC